jgi:hypothetical protein
LLWLEIIRIESEFEFEFSTSQDAVFVLSSKFVPGLNTCTAKRKISNLYLEKPSSGKIYFDIKSLTNVYEIFVYFQCVLCEMLPNLGQYTLFSKLSELKADLSNQNLCKQKHKSLKKVFFEQNFRQKLLIKLLTENVKENFDQVFDGKF